MLKLDINLLWTVVNVLVMYAVLRKFLFKPVQDVIAKRQQMVDANLADAETSKKEAAETMNAAQEKLRNVDNEAAARREAYEKQAEVEKQQLLVRANAYLPTDPTSIPTGEIVPVAETPFDFTAYRSIGEALEGKHEQLTYASGIDHSYVVDSHAPFQAAAYSAESGIGLTCTTTQPAVHVYTGNFVHVPESLGKNGHRYTARSGFCLETQNYPDAIHHPNFPTPILPANTPYRQVTTFHFSLGREEA